MTTPIQTPSETFLGNDAATEFPLTFQMSKPTYVDVYHRDIDGELTLLADTLYSVSLAGSADNIYKITYPLTGSPLPLGDALIAVRSTPAQQSLNISQLDGFDAEAIEDAFDYQMEIEQENRLESLRSIKVPFGQTGFAITPLSTVGAVMMVGDNLSLVEGPTADQISSAQTDAQRAEDAAAAAEAAANASAIAVVFSQAELKAVNSTSIKKIFSMEPGYAGEWSVSEDDYSLEVGVDTGEVVFAELDDADPTTRALVRADYIEGKDIQGEWGGLSPKETPTNNVTAWGRLRNVIAGVGLASLAIGAGEFPLNEGVSIGFTSPNTSVTLKGAGPDQTIFTTTGDEGVLVTTSPLAGPLNVSRAFIGDFSVYAGKANIAYGLKTDGQIASGSDADGGHIIERMSFRNLDSTYYFAVGIDAEDQGRTTFENIEYLGGYDTLTPSQIYGIGFALNRVGNHKFSGCHIQVAQIGIQITGDVEGVLCEKNTMVGVVQGLYYVPTTSGEAYLDWNGGHINAYQNCFYLQNVSQVQITESLLYWFAQGVADSTYRAIFMNSCYNTTIIDNEVWVNPGATPSVTHNAIHIQDSNQVYISGNVLNTGETNLKTLGTAILVEGTGATIAAGNGTRNTIVQSNTIKGWAVGCEIGTTGGIPRDVDISNNKFDLCTLGINIKATVDNRCQIASVHNNKFTRISSRTMALDSVAQCTVSNNMAAEEGVTMASNNGIIRETNAAGGKYKFFNNSWVENRGWNVAAVSASEIVGNDTEGMVLINRVQATIPAGSPGYVDVNHGLTVLPVNGQFFVQELGGGSGKSLATSNVTATQVRININGTHTANIVVSVLARMDV